MMKRIESTVRIPKRELDYWNRLLDIEEVDFEKEGIDCDQELERYTFNFGNGFEADIKVCSGQTNLFVDPVLFYKGSECCVLEPDYEVIGEYWFECDGTEYVAIIEEE